MSTITETNIAELESQLNAQILQGDILGAFDRFYADDLTMQENSLPPTAGKAANRKREEEFVGSVEQFHSGKVLASAVSGDVSFSEWEMDVTFKGAGRFVMAQAAVRRWKNGRVANKRFYYSKG